MSVFKLCSEGKPPESSPLAHPASFSLFWPSAKFWQSSLFWYFQIGIYFPRALWLVIFKQSDSFV